MAELKDVVVKKERAFLISDLQIKILQMVADDVSRAAIAKKVKLSIRTVEAHIDRVRNGVGLRSTTGLIVHLYRKGILK